MAVSHTCSEPLQIDLPDLSATAALARRLADLVRPGDVIALHGDLGVGKTAFARAFINALPRPGTDPAGAEVEEVPSPTFTLVQVYQRLPAEVWHIDLYRLERPEEAYELGLDDALGVAISLIEWPDRLGHLLPARRLDLTLRFATETGARRAALRGGGDWAERLRGMGRGVDAAVGTRHHG